MKILGVIPSRYASRRFPGKPLADIQGKSMIQRVYEQARKVAALSDVVVATDDERIKRHVEGFGGNVIMTSANHHSGTDRCAEVLEKYKPGTFDIIINIQGDEPFIQPEEIELLCSCFKSGSVQIATLIKKITNTEELLKPNTPKVIVNAVGEAVYFSRSPIPHIRERKPEEWLNQHTYFKHIGIYGFRATILREISKLRPSSWELAESLEQLRWLQNGYRIRTDVTDSESIAIDSPEDLKKIS